MVQSNADLQTTEALGYAAEGKKIISEEDYYKASHCVGALKTDN